MFDQHRNSIRASSDDVAMLSFYQSSLNKTLLSNRNSTSDKTGINKYVILPSSIPYKYFNYLNGLFLIFVLVCFPPYAAFYFRNEMDYQMEHFFEIALYIGDFIALIDIILTFFVSYPNRENNLLEIKLKVIVTNQLHTYGFYTNVISIIPFELTVYNNEEKGWIQILMFRRFLRFHKLFQITTKLDHYFIQSKIWPASKVFLFLAYAVHCLGCFIYMIRDAENTLNYEAHVLGIQRHPNDQSAYAIVMYDALLTILGESVDGVYTASERLFFTMFMLLGAVFNAVLFGQVALAVTSFQRSSLRYQEKMADVFEHMRSLKLPGEVQTRVNHFYDYMWNRNQCLEVDTFLNELSGTLQAEIRLFQHRELIHNVNFFKAIKDPACVVKLCLVMKSHFYLPGDFIVKENEYGDEMFMIASGSCEVLVRGKAVRTFSENDFFGEIALMKNEKVRRTATIRATGYSQIVSLHKPEFLKLMREYPESAQAVYKVMNKQISGYVGGGAANKDFKLILKERSASGLEVNETEIRSPTVS